MRKERRTMFFRHLTSVSVALALIIASGSASCAAEQTDPTLEVSEEELYRIDPFWDDPGKFKVVSTLAQASMNYNDLRHNARFNDYEFVKINAIDVSKWQESIDWQAVAADGIDAVIIRLGVRGYASRGNLALDKRYVEYLQGASDAGLGIGVYFFSQAVNVAEGIEEADFVLNTLKGFNLTLPVFFDVEKTKENGRLNQAFLTKDQQTRICKAFCDTIINGGYEAGVYSNKSFLETRLNMEDLSEYHVWLAHFTNNTSYKGEYNIWQYSETGSVAGISTAVDLDVIYSRKVNFHAQALSLQPGQRIRPILAGDGILTYYTSDPGVVTVSHDGEITAYGSGTAWVTANSSNGTGDGIKIYVSPSVMSNSDYYSSLFQSDLIAPVAGDANMDGWLNAQDAARVLMLSASFGTGSEADVDPSLLTAYDYNGDGEINASDAALILMYSASMGANAQF